MQGTWVWSVVQEDSTHCRATKDHKPQLPSWWSGAREARLLRPTCPRICALQQERPPRWQARALQLESNSLLAATRESLHATMKTQSSQKKKKRKKKNKALSLLLRISVRWMEHCLTNDSITAGEESRDMYPSCSGTIWRGWECRMMVGGFPEKQNLRWALKKKSNQSRQWKL